MFFKKLIYYPDAILDIFYPLSTIPWSILLHSGNNNSKNGRFDILAAFPTLTLISKNGVTEIKSKNKIKFSNRDPFVILQEQLKNTNIDNNIIPQEVFPFLGGALGIFGYDLIKYIEKFPKVKKKDLGIPDMAVGIYKWTIISDNFLKKLTLISFNNPESILVKLKKVSLKKRKTIIPFRTISSWKTNISKLDYRNKFRKIKRHLIYGDCYQICLSQQFISQYHGDAWSAFNKLLKHNRAPFSSFICLEDHVIISMSPERFLRVKNRRIKTQPIKGTSSRKIFYEENVNQIINLSSSQKNKSENLMIVDLLRNDIGRIAKPGSIKVNSLFKIETFSSVHHMISTITAEMLEEYSLCDLLRCCFPGGSITGAPKIKSMEILEMIEPHQRSCWFGSIGYISYCGTMDTNIAIRTLVLKNNYIYCTVGGAITFDSKEEEEYQEIIAKANSLLPLLK